ncbi:hypothetical protein J3A83DRAFT_1041311 [Scleroderma citrinum]
MSRGSTASSGRTQTQLPSQSAWAKGPPQNSNSSAPSPRSQSPAPPHAQSISASHSRRPSALGQGVPVKEGVSVPWNNVGSVRQGSSLNFGSIADVSAPVSSSPTATPVIRHESVKSFGSLPATAPASTSLVNGKSSASGSSAGPSRQSPRPMTTATSTSSPSPGPTSSITPATTSSTSTPPPKSFDLPTSVGYFLSFSSSIKSTPPTSFWSTSTPATGTGCAAWHAPIYSLIRTAHATTPRYERPRFTRILSFSTKWSWCPVTLNGRPRWTRWPPNSC